MNARELQRRRICLQAVEAAASEMSDLLCRGRLPDSTPRCLSREELLLMWIIGIANLRGPGVTAEEGEMLFSLMVRECLFGNPLCVYDDLQCVVESIKAAPLDVWRTMH